MDGFHVVWLELTEEVQVQMTVKRIKAIKKKIKDRRPQQRQGQQAAGLVGETGCSLLRWSLGSPKRWATQTRPDLFDVEELSCCWRNGQQGLWVLAPPLEEQTRQRALGRCWVHGQNSG